MLNSAESFPLHYGQARANFCKHAEEAGGALESFRHPERGPDGGELFCDVAWFGSRRADHVLVLISGTHGVEGFCGSGAQTDLIRRGTLAELPPNLGVLMIHAINPFGFAWLRRVTHENVDLNRNWLDFNGPLPDNPGYDELSPMICPAQWDEESRVALTTALDAFAARSGARAAQWAMTAGQYRHPTGVYYGGTEPTWSRRTQEAIFASYLGAAKRIAIIDYHTGLGPFGFGEKIVTQPRQHPSFRRAMRWYGLAVTSSVDESSSSSAIFGDGLAAAPSLLPHADVTAIALEIGTLSSDQVMSAVLADAWLHAHGGIRSAQYHAIKTQIRDAFYCDTDVWKGMVVAQSMLMCRQAVAGLLSNQNTLGQVREAAVSA